LDDFLSSDALAVVRDFHLRLARALD
jgi:hypothetical protein